MEAFFAHSSRDGYPPQTYEAHIRGVYTKASAYAAVAGQYAAKAKDILTEIVQESALMHDLGKLDDENQNVLHSSDRGKHHLPINHVDAGSAALKSQDSLYAALMVYSHHRGLPDLETESLREEAFFRDEHAEVQKRTDETLDKLLHRHEMIFQSQAVKETQPYDGDQNILFRMALSCLADADHSDTALAYGQAPTGKKSHCCVQKSGLPRWINMCPSSVEVMNAASCAVRCIKHAEMQKSTVDFQCVIVLSALEKQLP